MSLLFIIIGALMAAAALALILWPLLRRTGGQAPPVTLAIALAFALPIGALVLYTWIGTPAALNAAARAPVALDLDTAVAQLRARLEQAPDDVEAWVLLGRAYQSMQQNSKASAAFQRALALQPDNANLLVAAAEARSLARSDHRIDAVARTQLVKALAIRPDHQRALWLLGISQYQQQAYAEAIKHWQHLLSLIDPLKQATVAAAVQKQIERAEAALGSVDTPVSAASTAVPPVSTHASINVTVSLAPATRAKVSDDDTVFIYARAVDGPRMPLAVARLEVADLPAQLSLDDSMAMSPRFTLSMFPRVTVFARVSPSGQAMPQAGDYVATPATVKVSAATQATLMIDHPQSQTAATAQPADE